MKEMMKQKMMNRFHRRTSSSSSSVDFKSGERIDFKFSSLQALQVPKGWDKLFLSLISVEADKTVSKTGKASVWNGNCRWTENLSESIWLSNDDASKEPQQYLYKLLVSKGSTRSGILGEITVNLSSHLSSKASLPIALPLKKCDHGTILQVNIQCLTPRANLRNDGWRDMDSLAEDVNADYSDLDNTSDAPDGKNTKSVESSRSNSIVDASHARGLVSRETSISTVRSHRSFDSMEDSFAPESSRSNLSEVAVDPIGRPESTGSPSSTCSPRPIHSPYTLGSVKHSLNQRQDSGKVSNAVPASPLRTFGSSEFVLETEGATPAELRAEARTWERNARKLMVDLDLSRRESSGQTRNLENVTMELSASQTECKELKKEIEHLKVLLGESEVKERDADSLKVQVQDKNDIQMELEEEIKFQKELNDNLSLQLNKTQEANLELVSVLQELEETIEKQRLEMKNLAALELQEAPKTELQKFLESQTKLENTILDLETTLEDKTREIEALNEKSNLKEEKIVNLEAKLSQALDGLVSKENHDVVEEVKVLKDKILELERDCNELTDENLELLFKLKESSKDISTSGASTNSSSGERPSTEDSEVVNLECQIWPIKEDPKKPDVSENDSLKTNNDELLFKTHVLEKKLQDLESCNNELERHVAELEEDNLHLSDEKESSRLEAEHLHNRCGVLEAELRESKDSFSKLSKNLKDLEEKLSKMLDGIGAKEKIFDSEFEFLHLQMKEHAEKHEMAETLVTELLENTRLSEEKLKNTVSELLENTRLSEEKLRITVSELKSCEYEKQQLAEGNASFETQLQKIPVLQDEIVALKNLLNDLKYENERLEASLQMVSGDYEQLKEEKASLLVIELEDHRRNEIALEEKILQLQGDLNAREALSAQDVELKNELGRLKRSNSQLERKIKALEEQEKGLKPDENEFSTGRLQEDIKVDESSRIRSLEIALAEALEANDTYKEQLKSFMSEGQVRESDTHEEHKLEAELKELQERYLHMSLKYAEVEAQREELVLKLKAVSPGRSWFS